MKKLFALILAVALCAMSLLPALAEGGMMAGGWAATQDAAITEDAQAAFDKAMEGFVGSDIEPVALLGTQVVAGLNYCFLCRVTPVVPDAQSHYALVYVYAALDGTAQILQITDVVMGLE